MIKEEAIGEAQPPSPLLLNVHQSLASNSTVCSWNIKCVEVGSLAVNPNQQQQNFASLLL
jgi:hypothetical protein